MQNLSSQSSNEGKDVSVDSDLKVSIITVSYNTVKTIEQTILSVLNQTYKNIEYIIIDGQSTDGTCEIIEKYRDKIAYFISEPDNGIYDAMNKGIEKATGDIVGIINSDDWYELDAVEKIVNYFKTSSAELVYGKIWSICQDGTRKCSERFPIEWIWFDMIAPHPSVFVKREIYDKYGKFDIKYDIAADYDLLLRFYSEGVRFKYIDEIIANFRYGGVSTSTSNMFKRLYETWRCSLSHINECPIEIREKTLGKINSIYYADKFRRNVEDNPGILYQIIELFFDNVEDGVAIWGTGVWGIRCCEILQKCNVTIKMFVDNDSSKWWHIIDGVEVCPPEVLEKNEVNVIVAVMKHGVEIGKQMSGYGNPNLKWVTLDEIIDCFGCLDT